MIENGKCTCFFCQNEKEHPSKHTEFGRTSGRLLVAESLDPNHMVERKACNTCGHEIEIFPVSNSNEG